MKRKQEVNPSVHRHHILIVLFSNVDSDAENAGVTKFDVCHRKWHWSHIWEFHSVWSWLGFTLFDLVNLRKKYYQDVMSVYNRTISRLLNMRVDVNEHILNISSYELSWFYVEVWSLPFPNAYPASMLRRVSKKHIGDSSGTSTMTTPKNLLPLPYAP